MSFIKPFKINIPHADLDDLQARLKRTRWPSELWMDVYLSTIENDSFPRPDSGSYCHDSNLPLPKRFHGRSAYHRTAVFCCHPIGSRANG